MAVYRRHRKTGDRCHHERCRQGFYWAYVFRASDETGKLRQVYAGGFKTKDLAEKAERERRNEIDRGVDPFAADAAVEAYLTRWLEHQRPRLRAKTHQRYADHVRLRIVPALGRMQLSKVRPAHVQDAMNGWLAAGLAPRTVVASRMVLRAAFGQAVKWQLIVTNPVDAVDPPRAERPNLTVPTAPELMRLVDAAVGTTWEIPVVLSAATGARRGEVLALRWSDVDMDSGRVRITGTLVDTGSGWVRSDPKTDRGRRSVTLPAFALERLRAYRKQTAELMLASGVTWDWVCHRAGEPLDPDEYSKALKRIVAKAGLPSTIRLHDLRHAVATLWLEQGLHPGIASAALGHASPAFTMATYQHVSPEMSDKAAAALDAAFGAD